MAECLHTLEHLGRNKDYLKLSIDFTLAMNEDRDVAKYLPGPLKGYVVICICFMYDLMPGSTELSGS